eukprot:7935795-Ditylum_brightwellii.AAC.1
MAALNDRSGDANDGCQCHLTQFKSIAESGVNVIGITKDSPFVMGPWQEFLGASFPTLSDFTLEVASQYCGTFDLGNADRIH